MDRDGSQQVDGNASRSSSAGEGRGRLEGRPDLRVDKGRLGAMPTVAGPRSTGRRWAEAAASPVAMRGVILTVALMMAAFSVAPLLNVVTKQIYNKDYDLWQATGRIILDGRDLYPKTNQPYQFMYPPSCATMLAPLSPLPRGAFVAALLLVNSAAWTVCILGSVYLATGRIKGQHPGLYFWPSMAVIPFVHDTYLLGQPAILLLALLLGSFVCLRRGRPVTAGALIAVAAAIKAYPILAAGYLVYRRQWRGLAAMVVTLTALMFVAPLAFRTPGRVGEDFVLWVRGMLLKYDEETIAQRPDRAYSYKNQSIQATVHRLARPVLADGEKDRRWTVNLLSLDFRATTLLMLGSIGALGLFYLWSTIRPGPRAPASDAVEQSMVTILVLMLAPLSFNYSYVWLIFPLTVLVHLALASPAGSILRRFSWRTIALSVSIMALALPMLRVAQAYGNVFFSGLVLLIGLGIILRRGWIEQGDDRVRALPLSPAAGRESVVRASA
jgi:hypothetical protein